MTLAQGLLALRGYYAKRYPWLETNWKARELIDVLYRVELSRGKPARIETLNDCCEKVAADLGLPGAVLQ